MYDVTEPDWQHPGEFAVESEQLLSDDEGSAEYGLETLEEFVELVLELRLEL